jgi:type I restriction enzyme S subunit
MANKTNPQKWTQVKLQDLVLNPKNDIVDGPFGSNLKASEYVNSGVPIIRLQNINRNQFINKKIQFITENKAQELKRHEFIKGDIVITKLGNPLGKACIVPDDFEHGVIVADVVRVRINPEVVNKKYLVYAINSQIVIEQLTPLIKGSTRPRVNLGHVRNLTIPYVSLPEQERIVRRIESLLTQLEAGVAGLKRAQAALKRYKASVLKAACEGRLVAQEEGDEPADAMLRRMGKEPLAGDGLAELPEGWVWVTVEKIGSSNEQIVLTGPFGSNLGREDFIESGVAVLTIGCLTEYGLNLDKAKLISEVKAKELNKYRVREGDLLFSRMATVGRAGLVTRQYDNIIFNYHLMRLRLDDRLISTYYFLYYVRGSRKVTEYVRAVNHGATRDGINTGQLLSLPVSLPPLDEQYRIIAEVERRLSVVQALEGTIEANLRRAGRLRQAILKRAFEGRLV